MINLEKVQETVKTDDSNLIFLAKGKQKPQTAPKKPVVKPKKKKK